MTGRPHIVEIDSIVLDGVDVRRPERAFGLLEAQLLRTLATLSPEISSLGARGSAQVAQEITGAVIGALPGVPNGS